MGEITWRQSLKGKRDMKEERGEGRRHRARESLEESKGAQGERGKEESEGERERESVVSDKESLGEREKERGESRRRVVHPAAPG